MTDVSPKTTRLFYAVLLLLILMIVAVLLRPRETAVSGRELYVSLSGSDDDNGTAPGWSLGIAPGATLPLTHTALGFHWGIRAAATTTAARHPRSRRTDRVQVRRGGARGTTTAEGAREPRRGTGGGLRTAAPLQDDGGQGHA